MAKSKFNLADINRYYAMIICRMSNGARLKIYRKLISLYATVFPDGRFGPYQGNYYQ